MLNDKMAKVAYPEDVDLVRERWQQPLSFKRLFEVLCSLDNGGWKFHIASRSLFAGGLAFLFRMFVRLPFDNIMFFCVIMFTMFALMLGNFSVRRTIWVAALLYGFSAISFFMLATLFQFPGLQLLFLCVYTMILMSCCKFRLIAIMPIGYGCIAVALPGSWYAGVNYVLALAVCFGCTLLAVLLFSRAYTATVESLILKYLRDVQDIYKSLVIGEQVEGVQLVSNMRAHNVLSVLIKKLTSTAVNDNLGGQEVFKCRGRYIHLRELSRGLSFMRGFVLEKPAFCSCFPRSELFFKDVDMMFHEIRQSILFKKEYQGPTADLFETWSCYFNREDIPVNVADYAYVFSSFCVDVQRLLVSWQLPDTGFRHYSAHHFFSRQTRMWEALRFTCGIGISFLVYKVFRIPYGQWIGMFTAFIYVVPQHGLVFQRINKGLAGTALGVILGFLAIELTLGYCYLWAYFFPAAVLFFLYIFLLRNDFAVLMVGFAFSLMFSLIISASEYTWPNLFQALAARMIAGLIAGVIVFLLEVLTCYNGAVIRDIRKSAENVFHNMADAVQHFAGCLVEFCQVDLTPDEWPKPGTGKRGETDEVSDILAQEGAIRLFCEALEFEIGYNHQMNKYYSAFLRHLHVCCLYIRKVYYLSRHPKGAVSRKQAEAISAIVNTLVDSLRASGNLEANARPDVSTIVKKCLQECEKERSTPVFRFLAQSLTLYASNFDKMQACSHFLTESSFLFRHKKSSCE